MTDDREVSDLWEAVDGAAGALARRNETKPDGRRLTLYRLAAPAPARPGPRP